MDYLIALVLITLSAFFSGLNLGLFTYDTQTLKRRAELGDKQAARIYPLRRKGNQLLTTLLLGNVTVNTVLAIYLGTIFDSVAAGFIATAIIFVFGEITPQAVFSRHALLFGSFAAPLVRIALFVFYPLAFPIAYILDRVLGHELPRMYSKSELMQIISEHEDSEHSPIDSDEERILHGALKFSHRKAAEVMTPMDNVAMLDVEERLTSAFFEKVGEIGYSRYPVYQKKRTNVIGILYTKDLLTEDENIAIKDTEEAFDRKFLKVKDQTLLDEVLTRMLKQKRHLGIVYDRDDNCVGVITLEDIIEEIIQHEIQDEDDEGASKENVTPPLSPSL
jgi:metal transporter CNNM